eukprot:tig00000254_g22550.t1
MAFVVPSVLAVQQRAPPSANARASVVELGVQSASATRRVQRSHFEGQRVSHSFEVGPSFASAARRSAPWPAAMPHVHVQAVSAPPAGAPTLSTVGASPRKALEGVSVYDSNKNEYKVNDLWGEKQVIVLALMRHLGCPFCWEMASSLDKIRPELEAAGVKVALVSVGLPEKAPEFSANHGFPLDRLYMSPDRSIYDALGLYNGLGRTFFNAATGKALKSRGFESLRESTKNYKMIQPQSATDAFQQGGLFVLAGDGVVLEHRDEATGDHADFAAVREAALAAAAALAQ